MAEHQAKHSRDPAEIPPEIDAADADRMAGEEASLPDRLEATADDTTAAAGNVLGNAGETVKAGMLGTLRGIDELEAQIITVVRHTVSNGLRATAVTTDQAVDVVRDVVKGAISATEEAGTGLAVTSKSVAKGLIMGVSDVGGDLIQASSDITRNAVRETAAVGGDLALVARQTVDGVVEATREIGGNVGSIATTAANAAVEAASDIGTGAVGAVRDILLGVVTGIKQVAGAALPKSDGRRVPDDDESAVK